MSSLRASLALFFFSFLIAWRFRWPSCWCQFPCCRCLFLPFGRSNRFHFLLNFAYICVYVSLPARGRISLITCTLISHSQQNSFALLWHQVSLDGYFFYLQYSTCHFLYLFSVDFAHGGAYSFYALGTNTLTHHSAFHTWLQCTKTTEKHVMDVFA